MILNVKVSFEGMPEVGNRLQVPKLLQQHFKIEHLERLDKRYRERYRMSMVENLKMLKAQGMDEFQKNQQEKYQCPTCRDVVCVHDGKCCSCGYEREKTQT